ncbi:uncharacterized membrane protein YhaH (DUF805 family) [Microbacterium proteolyticum]|nr:uncharacterized membrane protein YhaH (DUF805 family) [Microbacterium sp. SORGH_AS_0344]MDQ1171161.1 uncharacterized membrane protein YhaH (DUF805 family) [Microbacterium proteolyticum]
MTQLQSAVPLDQPYYGAPLSAAVQRFFRKYFTSHGRASRSEYWWWALVNAIVMAALGTALLVLVSAGRTVDGAGAATAPSDAGSVLSLLYLA